MNYLRSWRRIKGRMIRDFRNDGRQSIRRESIRIHHKATHVSSVAETDVKPDAVGKTRRTLLTSLLTNDHFLSSFSKSVPTSFNHYPRGPSSYSSLFSMYTRRIRRQRCPCVIRLRWLFDVDYCF
jgi:hypothetical protein